MSISIIINFSVFAITLYIYIMIIICLYSSKDKPELKAEGDLLGWNLRILKHITTLRDSDIVYVSFISEVIHFM